MVQAKFHNKIPNSFNMGFQSSKANNLYVIFKKGLINTMTVSNSLIPNKGHNLPFQDLQEE